MPLVSFNALMAEAERGAYAVGYFESWNLESFQAVADAAEATRSPVILGFSGIYLPHPERLAAEKLSWYAALGLEACRSLSVPACLLFNECPSLEWVLDAVRLGFGLVMFSEEDLDLEEQTRVVRDLVRKAHKAGCSVEAELGSPPGVDGEFAAAPEDLRLTDPAEAATFVERTDVDALSVNIGQAHLHGRAEVRLRLDRLAELRKEIPVPLVLHAASSVSHEDLAEAIRLGIRKINVGSVLKQSFFNAVRNSCAAVGEDYNPYEVLGSGLAADVLMAGRQAMQRTVEELMHVFGSAGKA